MRSAEKTEKKSHRAVNARSLANLRPYKPGKEWTGNAGGRPKSRIQSEAYRAELAKEDKNGRSNAELIAQRMVQAAINGNVAASKHIAEYVEGAPRQALDAKLGVMDDLAERLEHGRQRARATREPVSMKGGTSDES